MLRARGGVEANDEVVAVVVRGALLARGFGQQEGAPVCYASDHAAGIENDVAGCFGDSVGFVSAGRGQRRVWITLLSR